MMKALVAETERREKSAGKMSDLRCPSVTTSMSDAGSDISYHVFSPTPSSRSPMPSSRRLSDYRFSHIDRGHLPSGSDIFQMVLREFESSSSTEFEIGREQQESRLSSVMRKSDSKKSSATSTTSPRRQVRWAARRESENQNSTSSLKKGDVSLSAKNVEDKG